MEQTLNVTTTLTQFAQKHIKPFVLDWDKQSAFPKELFCQLAEMGLMGMLSMPEYGGLALNYEAYADAITTISQYCGSVGLSIAAHNSLVSQHICQFGNEAQKKKYLPGLCNGSSLGAWALTEPNAGSDAAGMTCSALRTDKGWALNGCKTFITQGASADVIVVIAKTDNGKNGHTAFLVEKNTPGFSAGKPLEKLGMRASETVELFFNDCIVSDDTRIGAVGNGFKQTMQILDGGRISIAALSLGIAKGAYELALQYAKKRQQFGKAIIDFQAIGFKLAEMATKIYAAELMLKDVCIKKDAGANTIKESAMCKLFASELAVKVSGEAVQIMGGNGYMTGFGVEKYYRDAKLCTIGEGTSEIQKLIIQREISR
ncbi:acyl-CoA dehydrogenase family protein [Niabella drilacis]|uniref:Cyclohex-1-ene-1-carbonyl-CoA dehydrogenase n=1 Tax=Niabella drilacis (strain DSM 25811 / CCM 8410 / CCUG 62505 / LMG 26954 / E90) TaxID=1285928 RepID=A0A1G7BW04_NIADE|nr:acyl-CoA dehydrogenase family protein [Niabella drilacis]SDE31227.1 Acyl-CoA dehydrogenase [Niabella drilacis]